MLKNSAGLTRPMEVATTTAARVACGMMPMSGARKSKVATAIAAVTIPATWVLAPALRVTAV